MKLVGHVGIDTAMLVLCDPINLGVMPTAIEPIRKGEADHVRIMNGNGVVVSTGQGDGVYPVYVEIADDGRIASVTVRFIETEDGGEE